MSDDKETPGSRVIEKIIVWGFVAFVLLIILRAVLQNYGMGYEKQGSLFEKRHYTTQYWIDVKPGDWIDFKSSGDFADLKPDGSETKQYRVKGDIKHDDGRYELLRVHWPNGDTTEFGGCDITDYANSKGEMDYEICTYDEEDRYFEVHIKTKVGSDE
ncbi:MAG: hypothetical protein ABH837_01885 [bacterium]